MFNTLPGDASLNIYFCSYFPFLPFSLQLSVWNGEEKGHDGDLELKQNAWTSKVVVTPFDREDGNAIWHL